MVHVDSRDFLNRDLGIYIYIYIYITGMKQKTVRAKTL